ncbi:hypothetical protein ACFLQK_02015 [bacterium]
MDKSKKKSEGVVTFKLVKKVTDKSAGASEKSSATSHIRKSVRIWTEQTGLELLNVKAWNNAVAESNKAFAKMTKLKHGEN